MSETLSSAELAVLAAAVGSNASPWIEDSALLELDRPILTQRLAAAREGLELREIARTAPDGSLSVLPPLDVPQRTAGHALWWALLTLLALLAILLVAMFVPETGGGFIYEQF